MIKTPTTRALINTSTLRSDPAVFEHIANEYSELAEFTAGEGFEEVAQNLRHWADLYNAAAPIIRLHRELEGIAASRRKTDC